MLYNWRKQSTTHNSVSDKFSRLPFTIRISNWVIGRDRETRKQILNLFWTFSMLLDFILAFRGSQTMNWWISRHFVAIGGAIGNSHILLLVINSPRSELYPDNFQSVVFQTEEILAGNSLIRNWHAVAGSPLHHTYSFIYKILYYLFVLFSCCSMLAHVTQPKTFYILYMTNFSFSLVDRAFEYTCLSYAYMDIHYYSHYWYYVNLPSSKQGKLWRHSFSTFAFIRLL